MSLSVAQSGQSEQPATKTAVVSATVMVVSALRVGARVKVCLSGEPGEFSETDGFVRSERDALGILDHQDLRKERNRSRKTSLEYAFRQADIKKKRIATNEEAKAASEPGPQLAKHEEVGQRSFEPQPRRQRLMVDAERAGLQPDSN